MTICITTDGFPPLVGGIATFNKHLVSILLDAGHTVIVLYVDYENSEDDLVTTEGAFTKVLLRKTYATYYGKWKPYFRPGGFNAPNWIAIGMAMKKWLLTHHQQHNIDIIEASDYGGMGIFLADSALPPVVITGHGSLLQFSRYNYTTRDDSYKVVKKLEELSYINAEAVIAHSPINKVDLEKLVKREIILATIPWTDDIPATTSKNTHSHNKLLIIGGLQPIKGIYDIMEAMLLLKPKYPEIKLNWVGADTWLAPGQKKMSSYLQKKYPAIWQQSFVWENELTHELTQLQIEAATLIIIPACFETFNYVALEAAANKKTILLTDGTGASYLFSHGINAWIIPANNPAALSEAILYLINNPELCRQLGEKAAELIEKILDPKKIISERMSIYKWAIQNRKSVHSDLHPTLSFLNKYHTSARKYYYCARRYLKKLIGRG